MLVDRGRDEERRNRSRVGPLERKGKSRTVRAMVIARSGEIESRERTI